MLGANLDKSWGGCSWGSITFVAYLSSSPAKRVFLPFITTSAYLPGHSKHCPQSKISPCPSPSQARSSSVPPSPGMTFPWLRMSRGGTRPIALPEPSTASSAWQLILQLFLPVPVPRCSAHLLPPLAVPEDSLAQKPEPAPEHAAEPPQNTAFAAQAAAKGAYSSVPPGLLRPHFHVWEIKARKKLLFPSEYCYTEVQINSTQLTPIRAL